MLSIDLNLVNNAEPHWPRIPRYSWRTVCADGSGMWLYSQEFCSAVDTVHQSLAHLHKMSYQREGLNRGICLPIS